MNNLFSDIIKDNLSGSGAILNKVQLELIDLGNEKDEIAKDILLEALYKIQEQFPQFGVLLHFVKVLTGRFQDETVIKGKQLTAYVNTYINTWKDSRNKASLNLIAKIGFKGKNVLVHSNSTAIHNLFGHLAEKETFPVVWQTYSSPAGEGLVQAKTISSMGFETHLIHEDALSNFMHDIDMAILGADLIREDAFLNKAGSYPLALLLEDFKKPLYLLAEKRKLISDTARTTEQINKLSVEREQPAAELDPGNPQGITVHNLYFEFTPLALVKKVFTD